MERDNFKLLLNGKEFWFVEVATKVSVQEFIQSGIDNRVWGQWMWEHIEGKFRKESSKRFNTDIEAIEDAQRYVLTLNSNVEEFGRQDYHDMMRKAL